MRDRLEAGLREKYPDIRVNGHPSAKLPNTSSIGFRGLAADRLISEMTDIAVSAGAACHSDHMDISSVLKAMHVPVEYAMGTIRFSVGRYTVPEDIDRAVEGVARAVGRVRTGPF